MKNWARSNIFSLTKLVHLHKTIWFSRSVAWLVLNMGKFMAYAVLFVLFRLYFVSFFIFLLRESAEFAVIP